MKRKAEDLTRGDVIINFLGAAHFLGDAVVVGSYGCGSVNVCDVAGNVTRIMLGYDTTVEVESPTLTPAQQHAEELHDAVRVMLDCLDSGAVLYDDYAKKYADLLAKIDPPKPPTLEEALTVVSSLYHMGREVDPARLTEAGRMLDRAREAGYLKEENQ